MQVEYFAGRHHLICVKSGLEIEAGRPANSFLCRLEVETSYDRQSIANSQNGSEQRVGTGGVRWTSN